MFFTSLSVCLSVCLSVAKISQEVLDRCSYEFVEGLALDQGPKHLIFVEFGWKLDEIICL